MDLREPCPTFRPVVKGRMVAPPQARLVEPPSYVPPVWAATPRVAAGLA
ncbi:MAG: hypothetical protein ACXVYV_03580 [Gaiellales bacterium]